MGRNADCTRERGGDARSLDFLSSIRRRGTVKNAADSARQFPATVACIVTSRYLAVSTA